MDGNTIQQIRKILLDRWRKIEAVRNRHTTHQITHQTTHLADTMTSHAEMMDIAQALEQIERDASLKEAERRDLAAVERALAKMSTGNFGICEECGEEIPSKRLMVLPEARLCAHCQEIEERQLTRNRMNSIATR